MDFVTASRFLRDRDGTPAIQEYKQAIPNIPIYDSIGFTIDTGEYRREARTLWSQGVYGSYRLNFLCSRELGPAVEPPSHLLKELGDPMARRTRPRVRSPGGCARTRARGRCAP
jgi:hypothetical protein